MFPAKINTLILLKERKNFKAHYFLKIRFADKFCNSDSFCKFAIIELGYIFTFALKFHAQTFSRMHFTGNI